MRDMEWQEKVLDEILARTGGWKVEAMLDPAIHDWSLLYLIRLGHKNLNLVFGGVATTAPSGCWARSTSVPRVPRRPAMFKMEWEKKGAIVAAGRRRDDGPDRRPGRRRHRPLGELHLLRLRTTEPPPRARSSSSGPRRDYGASAAGASRMETWNAAARGVGRLRHAERRSATRCTWRAPQPDVFRYQARLREALNPNDLGDQYYETLDDD